MSLWWWRIVICDLEVCITLLEQFFSHFLYFSQKTKFVKKNSHFLLRLKIKILTRWSCSEHVQETFVRVRILIFGLKNEWEFFLTIFVFFSEWRKAITFSNGSRKVCLLKWYPCIFESSNAWLMLWRGFGSTLIDTFSKFGVENLKILLFEVNICSFCRGIEIKNLTKKIRSWTWVKKLFSP